MAQSSWPFENIDTTESQFSRWARNIAEGVKGGPNTTELLVTGDNSGMQIRVAAGEAMVRGHYYLNDSQATVSLDAADVSNDRIDIIVLELDPTANTILLKKVTGTAAPSPTAPSIVQTDAGIYQIELAQVTVSAGVTTILSTDVSDTRIFMTAQNALNPFLLIGA